MKAIKNILTTLLLNGFIVATAYEYLYTGSGWGNLFLLYTWAMSFILFIVAMVMYHIKDKEEGIKQRLDYQKKFKLPFWLLIGIDFVLVGALAYQSKFALAGAWLWMVFWQHQIRIQLIKPVDEKDLHRAKNMKLAEDIADRIINKTP